MLVVSGTMQSGRGDTVAEVAFGGRAQAASAPLISQAVDVRVGEIGAVHGRKRGVDGSSGGQHTYWRGASMPLAFGLFLALL